MIKDISLHINFYSQSIKFVLKNKIKLRHWIISVVLNENKKPADINFIFCSDSYLLKLNKSYLNHDYYTDIITFDYSEPENPKLETPSDVSHFLNVKHLLPDACYTHPSSPIPQNSKLRTQNSKLETQNSELKTQNSELKTQNSEPKTQNSKLETQNSKLISGDIFISIDRVKENAEKFNLPFIDELHRVIIHGVLHLIGYTDTTPKQKKLMTSKEDYYLSLRYLN